MRVFDTIPKFIFSLLFSVILFQPADPTLSLPVSLTLLCYVLCFSIVLDSKMIINRFIATAVSVFSMVCLALPSTL